MCWHLVKICPRRSIKVFHGLIEQFTRAMCRWRKWHSNRDLERTMPVFSPSWTYGPELRRFPCLWRYQRARMHLPHSTSAQIRLCFCAHRTISLNVQGAWARLPQSPPLGKMFDGVMQVTNRHHFGTRRGSASALNLCGGHQEQPRSASYCGLHALIDLSY